jgi:hypothetical protein
MSILYKRHFLSMLSATFLVCMIISCKSRNNISKVDNLPKRKIIVKNSSLTEYIKSAKETIRNELEFQLGVKTLKNGFNGTQIRIYKFSAWGNNEQMIIISENNSNWSAILVKFSIYFNANEDSVGIVIETMVKKEPHSAWGKVIDSLNNLDIFSLPDSDSIRGYDMPNDGGAVEVEYATGNKYRDYEYYAPNANYLTIAEAKKMIHIMNLMEHEFGFKDFGFQIVSKME